MSGTDDEVDALTKFMMQISETTCKILRKILIIFLFFSPNMYGSLKKHTLKSMRREIPH